MWVRREEGRREGSMQLVTAWGAVMERARRVVVGRGGGREAELRYDNGSCGVKKLL